MPVLFALVSIAWESPCWIISCSGQLKGVECSNCTKCLVSARRRSERGNPQTFGDNACCPGQGSRCSFVTRSGRIIILEAYRSCRAAPQLQLSSMGERLALQLFLRSLQAYTEGAVLVEQVFRRRRRSTRSAIELARNLQYLLADRATQPPQSQRDLRSLPRRGGVIEKETVQGAGWATGSGRLSLRTVAGTSLSWWNVTSHRHRRRPLRRNLCRGKPPSRRSRPRRHVDPDPWPYGKVSG